MESLFALNVTIHDWAAGADGAQPMTGRGTVYSVPAPVPGPEGRSRWAVRHYRRGGVLAKHLGDRYLLTRQTRPLRELWASAEARLRGVDTPAVVAGAVYRTRAFYRADLVTGLVPEGRDLAQVVFSAGPNRDAEGALTAVGKLVRHLEEARVLHADLNAKNVVLGAARGGLKAYVLDMDRCTILPRDSQPPRSVMRRRLERSLHKLGKLHNKPLTEAQWGALAVGFDAK